MIGSGICKHRCISGAGKSSRIIETLFWAANWMLSTHSFGLDLESLHCCTLGGGGACSWVRIRASPNIPCSLNLASAGAVASLELKVHIASRSLQFTVQPPLTILGGLGGLGALAAFSRQTSQVNFSKSLPVTAAAGLKARSPLS